MTTINLRDLFPEVKLDCFVEVSDSEAEAFKSSLTKEIADVYFAEQRRENAYQRRVFWNKAHFSLDAGDGIERDAINMAVDPFEMLRSKLNKQQLFDALNSLPEKQLNRLYAHFFLGMSKAEIARKEGVDEKNIRQAIERGLSTLKNCLKIFSE